MQSKKMKNVVNSILLIALFGLSVSCASNPNATLQGNSPHTSGSQHAGNVAATTIAPVTQ